MDANAEGKRIRETFEGNADKALEKLRKKLEKGTATYADVLKYASETGQEAGRVLAEELVALYPDGIIPEADAARLLPPTLRSNNALVLDAAGQVQKAKNLKEGVQLNAVLPDYNTDYEQMLIRHVAEVVKTDKFWTHTFPQSVENMAMCAVDDTVRANADFQVRSGIHRKIRRQTVGKCCQWCSDLAGTYDYENVNNAGNDVWRRHKNCDCLIEDVRDGIRGVVYNYREANTVAGRAAVETRKQTRAEGRKRLRIPQIPASSITEKVKRGEYTLKLSKQNYDKHVTGTIDYDRYMKSRVSKGLSLQSVLTISYEEAQEIIYKQSGTGIIKVKRNGDPTNIEQITCDRVIGYYYQKGEPVATRKAAIHYGQRGAHLVPIKGSHYD